MYFTNLFKKDYQYEHVADQTIAINHMVEYFLVEDKKNRYYITNIVSYIIYYTYDIVKIFDESDITTNLGYKYTIIALKEMFYLFKNDYFEDHITFIESYKNTLDANIKSE